FGRRHHPAPHPAGPPPRLPRSLGAPTSTSVGSSVPGPDGQPAARNLGALLRVASDWTGDLFSVREETQRVREKLELRSEGGLVLRQERFRQRTFAGKLE